RVRADRDLDRLAGLVLEPLVQVCRRLQALATNGEQVFARLHGAAGLGQRRANCRPPGRAGENLGEAVTAVHDLEVGPQQTTGSGAWLVLRCRWERVAVADG